MRTTCRSCGSSNLDLVIDLGEQPPSNALLTSFDAPEKRYPLRAVVCTTCCLMQTDYDVPHAELFGADYPYYSGQSQQWRAHCADYAADITKRLGLSPSSYVIEVGGNDGTLLKNFKCDMLNVEPSRNVALESARQGVPTIVNRFQDITANRHGADLIVANNVLAHDPDLNGFAEAIARNLAPKGTCTIEFPWVLKLLEKGEFDTIYHEHYSYFSMAALGSLLARHGLCIYDAEYLDIHGGSVRAYVGHVKQFNTPVVPASVFEFSVQEFPSMPYKDFQARAHLCANDFDEFLLGKRGKVFGAGAAAKASVFLNFCGLTYKDIPFIGDNTPAKQGKLLPGSRILVETEEAVVAAEPDYIVIFPWNWKNEIAEKYRAMGYKGKFVTAIPQLEVFD